MKILQILSGTGPNGAAQHCLWLTRELVDRGHQVTMLCRSGAWIVKQMADVGLDGVLESSLGRWPPAELRRVAAQLRQSGIQVMHSHMSDAHAFGVLLRMLTGIPCVATAHNTYIQLHWAFNDRVIAVSDAVRRFHRRYNAVSGRRIVTIYNFLDRLRLAEIDQGLRDRTARHPLSGGHELLIGYAGTVERRKGLIYLVQALADAPDCRLLVAGNIGVEPKYYQRVRRLAQRLGVAHRIEWLGHRPDLPALLATLDALVIPSLREPCPLVLLEAKASYLPVVATRCGGPEELIRHGEDGLLVDRGDPAALAAALNLLAADPRRRMALGRHAAERVRRDFSVGRQVDQIEALLAEVCAS
jgi:glycosyltransferase involved in cell wall biosynthesis